MAAHAQTSPTGVLALPLADEAATLQLGQQLAEALPASGVIYLHGCLGAGKTTLTRALIRALGHTGAVKSPTYTLVEPYNLAGTTLYHFDLYRLSDPEELEYMGIRDYFSNSSLCIVEWPERGVGVLPPPDLAIELCVQPEGRLARLTGASAVGASALVRLEASWTK